MVTCLCKFVIQPSMLYVVIQPSLFYAMTALSTQQAEHMSLLFMYITSLSPQTVSCEGLVASTMWVFDSGHH